MNETRGAVLRAAIPADAEPIARLLTDEGYPAGPPDIIERLERFAGDGGAVLVADVAGEVAGFIAAHVIPRFEHGDEVVRVLAMVVDPGVRDRGIGHLLLGGVEEIARSRNAAFLEVTSGHHRPDARHLFESAGYDATLTTYLRKRI